MCFFVCSTIRCTRRASPSIKRGYWNTGPVRSWSTSFPSAYRSNLNWTPICLSLPRTRPIRAAWRCRPMANGSHLSAGTGRSEFSTSGPVSSTGCWTKPSRDSASCNKPCSSCQTWNSDAGEVHSSGCGFLKGGSISSRADVSLLTYIVLCRMAVERELDKTETNLGNIIFDESGYVILYPTMLGIKMVNLYTNRCIKIMGKPENIRPMQLTLFQVLDTLSSQPLLLDFPLKPYDTS